MSDEAAQRAAKSGRRPYAPYDEAEVDSYPPFPFPSIGDYEPPGWEKVEDLFADSSGFGRENEPALTVRGLKEKVKEYLREPGTHGFAITEIGQFQVYVGVFKKKRKARAP